MKTSIIGISAALLISLSSATFASNQQPQLQANAKNASETAAKQDKEKSNDVDSVNDEDQNSEDNQDSDKNLDSDDSPQPNSDSDYD